MFDHFQATAQLAHAYMLHSCRQGLQPPQRSSITNRMAFRPHLHTDGTSIMPKRCQQVMRLLQCCLKICRHGMRVHCGCSRSRQYGSTCAYTT